MSIEIARTAIIIVTAVVADIGTGIIVGSMNGSY